MIREKLWTWECYRTYSCISRDLYQKLDLKNCQVISQSQGATYTRVFNWCGLSLSGWPWRIYTCQLYSVLQQPPWCRCRDWANVRITTRPIVSQCIEIHDHHLLWGTSKFMPSQAGMRNQWRRKSSLQDIYLLNQRNTSEFWHRKHSLVTGEENKHYNVLVTRIWILPKWDSVRECHKFV